MMTETHTSKCNKFGEGIIWVEGKVLKNGLVSGVAFNQSGSLHH
jgi:hypothetical protein